MGAAKEAAVKAKKASFDLAGMGTKEKNKILLAMAQALLDNSQSIIEENKKDIDNYIASGRPLAIVDRLKLDEKRIEAMAQGLKDIAALADPIGETVWGEKRPNGLNITKVRVPMGVIGIIYEARPNVTADAIGLCFKTSNAVILKGGKEAICSNIAIVKAMCEAAEKEGMPKGAVNLIEDTTRESTNELMQLNGLVDVLIPRGGAGLISAVVKNATVPVIETGVGNCHVFVDESADIEKAVAITVNAKAQRPSVCNAAESLLVHENIADKFLPKAFAALKEKNVHIKGDAVCQKYGCDEGATEEDYATEFLDYVISVKVVKDVDEAISHINRFGTKHSEAIVTNSYENQKKFKQQVDAACVYVNASTRFTDGFEFGFGAEIGISTQKLHARGPMGLREMTTTKYLIDGDGQTR